ncbi:MAG TPA: PEP/pyruvate-binding domain-containing protein [Bdellovibrionales bacterium]|nr:PEP/pyruvate-binding domain-containing protein [Bdellovibrionales bacterium]
MVNSTRSANKGSKAERLAWMRGLGFKVPPFIVLSPAELQDKAHLAAKISGFMASCPKGSSFAVRSSVEGEDGADNSFAGIMESFLNQSTLEEILECAGQVAESAQSERAKLYRLHRGLPVESISASVVIQRMVFADRSGVMFTANPVTGDRRQTLISAAYGSCEGVVDGHSDCDEYIVQNGAVGAKKIAEKHHFRETPRGGRGTSDAQVPENLAGEPVLSDTELSELESVGRAMAREFGAPLDIEWSIERGQLYLLQCRPVSSPALKNEAGAPKLVFDNSNIQESFCGVTLPLTFSFASQAYCSAYSQLMRVAGFSEKEVQKHHHRHRNMLSYVRGRVYYNINNWYEGLRLLPSFKRNKADMEKMMGVDRPVDFVSSFELTFAQKMAVAPRLARTLANLIFNFAIISRKFKRFTRRFDEEYRKIMSMPLSELTSFELHKLLGEVSAKFLALWDTPLYNDFYVMVYNGKVTRALKAVGLERQAGDLLLVEGLESTAPTKKLVEIAELVANRPCVRKLFDTSSDELWDILRGKAPDIHAKCLQYIEEYGDRVAGELKLETITLRQDRAFLAALIKSYLQSGKLSLKEFLNHEARVRGEAEAVAYGAIERRSGALAVRAFKSNLGKLRRGIYYRESMRLRRTRLFGLIRMIYAEIGSRWAGAGILSEPRDIFYLTQEEIADYFDGRAVMADLKPLIAARRAEFAQYEREDLPGHIQASVPVYNKTLADERAELPEGALMSGTGCYPGQVSAEVDVRFAPGEPDSLKGKILCTVRTDPGWAPVFFNIKGLIVERGSTLSHSAIIARELGIPAIVGVDRVTKRLSTGETITMDGESGQIHRAKNETSEVDGAQNTVSL